MHTVIRRPVLRLRFHVIFAASLLAADQSSAIAEHGGKYNVLMIAVDDLRPTFGCYGHPEIKTPNLDALATGGILFERAYVSQAVCSPSRTCLLTGRRPDTTKIYDLQTHFRKNLPDVVTLPQHFKQHGYYTQGMGKIYHGGLDDPPSWSASSSFGSKPRDPKGAQIAAGDKVKPAKTAAAHGSTSKPSRAPVVLEVDPKTGAALKLAPLDRSGLGPAWESPDVADDALSDGQLAVRAVNALRELKDRRFFLAVGFFKPHLPFVAPKKYFDLYANDTIALPANPYPPKNVPKFSLTTSGELRTYAGTPKSGPVSDEDTLALRKAYYAAASYTDAQIGRVLDELKRLGLEDNTIVVIWGDHGWKLGEHGSWCKQTNFELDTRAPLIFRVPGRGKAGTKTKALAEFVDIYPTLVELCGLPSPEGVEGTSLAPLIDDPNRAWKSAAFSQYPRDDVMGYAMRTDRYRYVEWQNTKTGAVKARELYDHRNDPDENENIADTEANRKLVAELSKQLAQGWREALPR